MALTTSAQEILQSAPTGSFPPRCWELMERYRAELMNQAYAILGSLEDAEDVVQETFCEAFRDVRRMKVVDSIGAWLRSVNRFNAFSRIRARRRDSKRVERKQSELRDRLTTTGGLSAVEVRESVAKAIELLPEKLRSVVVLRYWEHLSYKDIAQRLGVPVGTVGTMLYEASQHLFDKLNARLQLDAARPAAETDATVGAVQVEH